MVGRPWRVGIGLADPDRLHALLAELDADGALTPIRALSAEGLVQLVRTGAVDVVLLRPDFHGLTVALREVLLGSGVPLVVLTTPDAAGRWPGPTIPDEAPTTVIRAALVEAARGASRPRSGEKRTRGETAPDASSSAPSNPVPVAASATDCNAAGMLVAVAGGHGAPGRTTVALNLAAALGAVAPTCLLEADCTEPALGLLLDVNPTHHLSVVHYADPTTPTEWEHTLARECQPLDARSPRGRVLLGIPKLELRAGLAAAWYDRLLAEVRARHAYVVADTGGELVSPDQMVHRAVLRRADLVLLVTRADVLSVRRTQRVIHVLREELGLSAERLALVVNAYAARRDDDPATVAATLGVALAAVVPSDPGGLRRALDRQRPMVALGRSRAGPALLGLADRLHDGGVVLPPEPATRPRRRWRLPWLGRVGRSGEATEGVADGSGKPAGRQAPWSGRRQRAGGPRRDPADGRAVELPVGAPRERAVGDGSRRAATVAPAGAGGGEPPLG